MKDLSLTDLIKRFKVRFRASRLFNLPEPRRWSGGPHSGITSLGASTPTSYIVDGMPVETGTLTSRISEAGRQCVGPDESYDIESYYPFSPMRRKALYGSRHPMESLSLPPSEPGIQAPRSLLTCNGIIDRSEH